MLTKEASSMVAMDLGMVLVIDLHYICPAGKSGSSMCPRFACMSFGIICRSIYLITVCMLKQVHPIWTKSAQKKVRTTTYSLPTPSMYHPDRPDHDHIVTTPSSHWGPTQHQPPSHPHLFTPFVTRLLLTQAILHALVNHANRVPCTHLMTTTVNVQC